MVVSGQDNNANIWYFGEYAGIDFNYGLPHALTDGQTYTREGCATICDSKGELLFYTEGTKVWDRNHQIMPNGNGLMGDTSATQSSIIVPLPHSGKANTIYYVFTVDNWQDNLINGFRYSIIDMNLNTGLGDIVNGKKNIQIHDKVSEKLCAVMHANMKDVWVITHDWGSNDFLAYLLTENGLTPMPIISSVGTTYSGSYSNAVGYMKPSMQYDRIALAIKNMSIIEIFDFDNSTGILTNPISVQSYTYDRVYGVEFSPDGSRLYASLPHTSPFKIFQFDLTAGSPVDIINSSVLVASSFSNCFCDMQVTPLGDMYIANHNGSSISRFNNPNGLGLDCNHEDNFLDLEGKICQGAFPPIFTYSGFQFFIGSETDATICEGDSVFLENAWQTNANTYYDTLQSTMSWDSIVSTHLSIINALPAPIITENEGVLYSSLALYYQWYFNGDIIAGATNQMYQPLTSGNYMVVVHSGNDCKSFSNEFYFDNNDIGEDIEIYPNPVIKLLTVKFDGDYSVEVNDLNGKRLYEKDGLSGTSFLDFETLSRSIYILKVYTANIVFTEKIIKR